jgi:hypothetical protein
VRWGLPSTKEGSIPSATCALGMPGTQAVARGQRVCWGLPHTARQPKHHVGVSKKPDKLIKLNRRKKPNRKNRINQLKNHKKVPVRFGFGFQSLKPIKPNQTKPVQPGQHLKKKQV